MLSSEDEVDPRMMAAGTRVADRFEIEQRAGSGGMGIVFRARDRRTDQRVALKVLLENSASDDMERFAREGRLLSELRHPGVVTYVAHGRTARGLLYLALEWLEGEDLSRRLKRQPLTVEESLVLMRVTAEALAAVHRYGVVHRDIKPSNLFLRDGQVERATLIDFGIARGGQSSWSVTRTGQVVGTLQYIAPEQARGENKIGPSADIFAVGCVLYECLIGTPPFSGQHLASVLMRILLEEVPPLRRLRPELPESLEKLLARMLAKEPTARPTDGEALRVALANLELPATLRASMPGAIPSPELLGEQRLVNIVLALPRPSIGDGILTIRFGEEKELAAAQREELERALGPFGIRAERLPGGAVLVSLSQPGHAATDQTLQAIHVALLVREHLPPQMAVAVATGTMSHPIANENPAGGVLERASQLVLEMSELNDPVTAAQPWPVLLDRRTAELIDTRFDVRPLGETVFVLEGERTGGDEIRPLMGRPTPFVGREQELQLLEAVIARCYEDASAQVLLVIGPAGVGKSRLRYELLHRMAARGERVEIMLGRGEPLRAGAAYSVLVNALSRLCGMGEGMDVQRRRAQLTARVERHVPPSERRHVMEFLGELCGLSFPDSESPQLKAARQDARVMLDRVTAAFVTFLRAECSVHPVLLALEDLHWGDAATVHLVDVALRELESAPLFVLALGRPEVQERFPRLWEQRNIHEIRLSGLSRRASEHLAREMLGEQASDETLARIVGQARGHALFLEELIRAVAEGQEDLPETVLAMLQARFLRLDPEARRLLRAASILGETFWRGGVKEILNLEQEGPLDLWLESLIRAEMIVRQEVGRFAGDRQFAFRHALVREAAYNLLGEEDRRHGHRQAGAYLERTGERDALVLAEHYERGGERERAAFFFARAARQALGSNDYQGALRLVARGVACGARDGLLGTLRAIETRAQIWLANFPAAYEAVLGALELLPVGGADWVSVQGAAALVSCFQGERDRLRDHIERLAMARLLPGAESAFMESGMEAGSTAAFLGMHDLATAFLARLEEVAGQLGRHEPRARGALELATLWCRWFEGDPWHYKTAGQRGADYFSEAADRRWLGDAKAHEGVGLILLGEIEQGRASCQEAQELFTQIVEPVGQLAMQALLAFALAEAAGPAYRVEAHKLAEQAVGDPLTPSFWAGMAHIALAIVQADEGQRDLAEQVARQALQRFGAAPAALPLGCAVLGRILLVQWRLDEARAVIEDGLTQLRAQGGRGLYDSKLHLVAAEVWCALGQEEAARAALAEAERSLARCTGQIPDPAARQRFLDHSREHARLRALRTPPLSE